MMMNTPKPMVRRPVRAEYPANITSDMNKWRVDGCWGPCPESYIKFHENLAREEIARLELCFGVTIQNIPWMQESGWFDGMFELNVNVLTCRGTNMHLRWCDSNQSFMVKLAAGGSAVFYEDELSL